MILERCKPPRFLKILGACSFAVWFSAMGVFFYYDGTRPEAPSPEGGQIYESNNHGHVVYVSFRDGLLFYGLMVVGAVGAIATFAIGRRIQESRRSGPARYFVIPSVTFRARGRVVSRRLISNTDNPLDPVALFNSGKGRIALPRLQLAHFNSARRWARVRRRPASLVCAAIEF